MSVASDAFCAKLATVGFTTTDAMAIWTDCKAKIDKHQLRKDEITKNIQSWQNEKASVDAEIQRLKTFLGI